MKHNQFLKDEESTEAFGSKLARATFREFATATESIEEHIGTETVGAIIHLEGDLGAGKTTLARGFMRGYGVLGAIKSPTYTLVEPYELQKCALYHFDLYRLADPDEMEYLGFEDYFHENSVCLIEWATLGAKHLPKPDLVIELESSGTGRSLSCHSKTEKGGIIAQRLWP